MRCTFILYNVFCSSIFTSELNKQLSPDPQRAEELRIEFTKGFDETIVRRIWPHVNFAMTITSGKKISVIFFLILKLKIKIVLKLFPWSDKFVFFSKGSAELYAKKLREKYFDIPIISPFYLSTEGIIATNVCPQLETPEYVLLPWAQFFEFIPIENAEEEQPKVLYTFLVFKQSVSFQRFFYTVNVILDMNMLWLKQRLVVLICIKLKYQVVWS